MNLSVNFSKCVLVCINKEILLNGFKKVQKPLEVCKHVGSVMVKLMLKYKQSINTNTYYTTIHVYCYWMKNLSNIPSLICCKFRESLELSHFKICILNSPNMFGIEYKSSEHYY